MFFQSKMTTTQLDPSSWPLASIHSLISASDLHRVLWEISGSLAAKCSDMLSSSSLCWFGGERVVDAAFERFAAENWRLLLPKTARMVRGKQRVKELILKLRSRWSFCESVHNHYDPWALKYTLSFVTSRSKNFITVMHNSNAAAVILKAYMCHVTMFALTQAQITSSPNV